VWIAGAILVLSALTPPATAQLIQIKTLPIADGDQWRIFPSANAAMGDLSIALADSLLDPFVNPAKAARIRRGGTFFGSPLFYSVSQRAGGGQTLPLGGIVRSGNLFASVAVALQEIDSASPAPQFLPVALSTIDGLPVQPPPTPSRQNQFAFASLGRVFSASGVSVAGSVLWSRLHDIDGVDLLYAGSEGVAQHGGSLDARLGLTKDWSTPTGARTAEAMVLHEHYAVTHDVTWADQVWDPNARMFRSVARLEHNLDKTDTWGLHLGYSQPLADSGGGVGGIATGNFASHPKLPDYQIAQVSVVPWDPGHSIASDLGLGLSKVHGATTFGLDAIYEPIMTRTWGEAQSAIQTPSGATIPAGGMTTENRFHFSNAILRAGAGQDVALGGATEQTLRLQLGVALHSIAYGVDQTDHAAETSSHQDEHWVEWTKTWGATLHFRDLELRYVGRIVTGAGRPGIAQRQGFVAVPAVESGTGGPDILSAPNGPLTLTGVTVMTHQFSVAVPLR
jgi:hypothetical protein